MQGILVNVEFCGVVTCCRTKFMILHTYQREEVFAEAAQNPGAFPTIFEVPGGKDMTNYLSSDNTYKLNTKATGVYAKVGFIALPTEHLRIGAAIQTPTLYQISESWRYFASACYENPTYDGEAMSTLGEYNYNLRSPYVFNAGIAYTLPGVGLFSLDYELTDYSVMKYKDVDQFYSESTSWDRTNLINRTFCGSSHAVRTGIEVKPLPVLAIRAGYSILTDPEKYWDDEKGNRVTAETPCRPPDQLSHSILFALLLWCIRCHGQRRKVYKRGSPSGEARA